MPESVVRAVDPPKKLQLATQPPRRHIPSLLAETVAGVAGALTAGTVVSHLTCHCAPAARLWLDSLVLVTACEEGILIIPFHRGARRGQAGYCNSKQQLGPLPHTLGRGMPHHGSSRRTPGKEGFSGQHPLPPGTRPQTLHSGCRVQPDCPPLRIFKMTAWSPTGE